MLGTVVTVNDWYCRDGLVRGIDTFLPAACVGFYADAACALIELETGDTAAPFLRYTLGCLANGLN